MKLISKIFSLLLTVCVIAALLSFGPAMPAGAIGLQEQSWLSHLRPANLPKPLGKDSYPAELLVAVANTKEVKLTGTCSLEGQLTDEEILDAIKKAAAESGYKSPENAVDDKLTVSKLKDKLSFNEEEKARIINNWLALVGMDKVAVILRDGKLPEFGSSDAVDVVTGMILSGELPDASSLVPVPTDISGLAQTMVVNGARITYDQFLRDQEKYRDIVELSNANARFREFSGKLNSIIKEETSKKTAWTIRIQNQVIEDQIYRTAPEISVPYIYTSDIVLTKRDGRFETPVGTYQGDFKIDIDLSLEDYDRNFGKHLADYFNQNLKDSGAYVPPEMYWNVVSHKANKTSENKTTLEGKNVYVTLADSLGGVFELKLDATALDVTYSKVVHDFVSVLRQKGESATSTLTWTEITDSETGTAYHQDHSVIIDALGRVTETDNTDDNGYPNVDVRTYLKLTLVVDMIGE